MRKLYKPSKGISVGLVWFLLYLLGFFALGYGLLFCIVLGIIGGMATGMVAEWWVSKDDAIAKSTTAKPVDSLPTAPVGSTLHRNTAQTQLRRHANRTQTPTTGLSRLKVPFQRGR